MLSSQKPRSGDVDKLSRIAKVSIMANARDYIEAGSRAAIRHGLVEVDKLVIPFTDHKSQGDRGLTEV